MIFDGECFCLLVPDDVRVIMVDKLVKLSVFYIMTVESLKEVRDKRLREYCHNTSHLVQVLRLPTEQIELPVVHISTTI